MNVVLLVSDYLIKTAQNAILSLSFQLGKRT